MRTRFSLAVLFGLLMGTVGYSQGPLSSQVLQLLTRKNTWTQTNTFLDFRLIKGVPSDTALRLYVDGSSNLYFNGVLVAGAGGGVTPHNLLSTTHPDTLAGSVARAAVIVGNATPAWALLQPSVTNSILLYNGTDTVFSTNGSGLTSLTSANLTGALPAIDGTSLTGLSATSLTSGTVPLARLSGILNAQIGAGAAIAYSKLALTGSVVNGDLLAGTLLNSAINAAAGIAYTKLTLTSSVVFADWASNACSNLQVPQYNGAAWVCKTLASTDISGSGTVTSVALALPNIFTVSGSPVTTAGTLTAVLATETANTLFAGPTSGGASAPTFRTLVNADLPLSGASAGTYPKVTINTAGVVTSTASQITLTTDVTGTLPMANGGTGVAVAGNNTLLIGSGAAWVAQTLPNCLTGALNFATATNLWSCNTTSAGHALLSAVHTDTAAGAPVRGGIIVANSTPAWAQVAKGSAGTLLGMGVGGTDPAWINGVSGLTSTAAGSGTLGSTALPFASLIVGTAATNNLSITPAAFAQGTVATADDPGLAAVKLGLLRRGTISYTGGSLTTGTCSSAQTLTITGLTTTSTVVASHNAAPGAQWQKGIYFLAYPTANTANVIVCNPTAGSITPDNATFNVVAVVP